MSNKKKDPNKKKDEKKPIDQAIQNDADLNVIREEENMAFKGSSSVPSSSNVQKKKISKKRIYTDMHNNPLYKKDFPQVAKTIKDWSKLYGKNNSKQFEENMWDCFCIIYGADSRNHSSES